MNEIKCPNCGEVFTVNESQYAELISQVRTAEFDKEIHERIRQELALAEQKALNEQQEKLAKRTKKLPSYKIRFNSLIPKKNWPKKRWSKPLAKVCWRKKKKFRHWRINWLPCAWSMRTNYKRLYLA